MITPTNDMFAVPMTAMEAEAATDEILATITTIANLTDTVVELIRTAEQRGAHTALGYPSWAAYAAERFSGALAHLAVAERIPAVVALAEMGMSTRAIAPIVGVSNATVSRHLSAVTDVTPDVSGRDGKAYVRNGVPTSAGMIAIADAVPDVRPKPRRRPLPDAYRDAVHELTKSIERMERLHADDRFDRYAEGTQQSYRRRRLDELADRVHVLGASFEGGAHDDA